MFELRDGCVFEIGDTSELGDVQGGGACVFGIVV